MSRRGLVAGVLLATAVAAVTLPAAAQDSARVRAPRRDRNLISRDMFHGSQFSNAYDIVEALKGSWMRERPSLGLTSRDAGTLASPRDSSTSPGTTPRPAGVYAAPSYPADPQRSNLGEPGGIQVYFDGTRMGAVDQLRNIPAATVMAIWYYNATDAQARFGVGHSSGVIFVSTRALEQRP